MDNEPKYVKEAKQGLYLNGCWYQPALYSLAFGKGGAAEEPKREIVGFKFEAVKE